MDLTQYGFQRAGMAAILVNILRAEKELTHDQIKNLICNGYARILSDGHFIGDTIDKVVLESAQAHGLQESALDEVKDILGISGE